MATGADRAYVAGLTLLARRELAEAQLRARLAQRKFEQDEIDSAIVRLHRERALDDRRTAVACARTEVRLRHRGRARVIRRIEALGIARDVARDAVAEVFADIDEMELLERALARRMRGSVDFADPAVFRRVHHYLVGQGFEPERVTALLHRRAKKAKSL